MKCMGLLFVIVAMAVSAAGCAFCGIDDAHWLQVIDTELSKGPKAYSTIHLSNALASLTESRAKSYIIFEAFRLLEARGLISASVQFEDDLQNMIVTFVTVHSELSLNETTRTYYLLYKLGMPEHIITDDPRLSLEERTPIREGAWHSLASSTERELILSFLVSNIQNQYYQTDEAFALIELFSDLPVRKYLLERKHSKTDHVLSVLKKRFRNSYLSYEELLKRIREGEPWDRPADAAYFTPEQKRELVDALEAYATERDIFLGDVYGTMAVIGTKRVLKLLEARLNERKPKLLWIYETLDDLLNTRLPVVREILLRYARKESLPEDVSAVIQAALKCAECFGQSFDQLLAEVADETAPLEARRSAAFTLEGKVTLDRLAKVLKLQQTCKDNLVRYYLGKACARVWQVYQPPGNPRGSNLANPLWQQSRALRKVLARLRAVEP